MLIIVETGPFATWFYRKLTAEGLPAVCWGLKLTQGGGFNPAAVAIARKLAVIMHAMWRNGFAFDPTTIPA